MENQEGTSIVSMNGENIMIKTFGINNYIVNELHFYKKNDGLWVPEQIMVPDEEHTYFTGNCALSAYNAIISGRHSLSDRVFFCFDMSSSAIEEPINPTVSVSPNPFKDRFSLGLDEFYGQPVQISIYDHNGCVVLTKPVQNEITDLELTGFPSGLYLVEIKVKSKVFCRKVLKY